MAYFFFFFFFTNGLFLYIPSPWSFFIHTLQKRKLRPIRVKELSQGHIEVTELKPGPLAQALAYNVSCILSTIYPCPWFSKCLDEQIWCQSISH